MGRKIRVCKDFTYSSIIKEAILSSKDSKATSSQIFDYITSKHPNLFKQSNSMTWKGNIRQLLSKNPEFVKLQKDDKSKLHYWKYVPIEDIIEKENNSICNYRNNEGSYPMRNIQEGYNQMYVDSQYSYDIGINKIHPYSMSFHPIYIPRPPSYTEDYFYGRSNETFGNFIIDNFSKKKKEETNKKYENDSGTNEKSMESTSKENKDNKKY